MPTEMSKLKPAQALLDLKPTHLKATKGAVQHTTPASILGRVWIPAFSKNNFKKMASVPPCIPCFFGARNLGRVLATLPYFAFSVATFFPHSDGAKSLRFVDSSIQARWWNLRSNWITLTMEAFAVTKSVVFLSGRSLKLFAVLSVLTLISGAMVVT